LCIIVIGLNEQHFKDNIYYLLETILDEINFKYKILNTDEILKQFKDDLDRVYFKIVEELKERDKSVTKYIDTYEIDEIFTFNCTNDSVYCTVIANVLYQFITKQDIIHMTDFNSRHAREEFEQYIYDVIYEIVCDYDESYVKIKVMY